MIEIVDEEIVASTLTGTYGEKLPDAILINVHYISSPQGRRSANHGLDVALERAHEGRPIVLYGFQTKADMMNDPRFVALMGRKNVAYVRSPLTPDEVISAYAELQRSGKTDDELAQDLLRLEEVDRGVARLRHDLGRAEENPTAMTAWLELARNLGFTGTQDEIVSTVHGWQPQNSGLFEGRFFEGVFVDVQGTLLASDGTLNGEVVKQTEELAAGRPITVWTDADLKAIVPQLRKLGIEWKIISKFEMAGAEVDEVIDDLTPEEFEQQYRIQFRRYHKIS